MNISLKTSVIVAAIGLLLAAPSTQADPISNYQCLQEYRACIAAGYDQDMCIDNYYYCRYGYYPVKASGAMMAAPARKD